jgi:hypothetical protein
LTTSNIGATSATISWNASTDNAGGSGVKGYFIYRNGNATALNATAVTTTTYTDTGLSSSTLYSYTVAAIDNANNLSAKSSSASLTTTIAGTFINTGSLAKGRISSTMTLLPNGKVLVAGGLTNSGSVYTTLASAELYDPTTGTFSPTGNMTTPRLIHSAVLLTNGKVLISGGFNDANAAAPLTSAEIYDPTTGIFTATGSMINGQYGSTSMGKS